MRQFLKPLLLVVLLASAGATPRVRPPEWAQPVINTSIGNCCRVSDELLRSEQPEKKDIPDLKALGVRTLINLRRFHDDSKAFEQAGLRLVDHEMRAGNAAEADLVAVLREFRKAPKPALVHCWHGSDRTGFVVAGYRIAFQGWTKEAAVDELQHGDFGYHAGIYKNIVTTINKLDEQELRRKVIE